MSKQNNVFKDAYNRGLQLFDNADALPSEPDISASLGVSRTTVRAILARMEAAGLIEWHKRAKVVLRRPRPDDYFPSRETSSLAQIIERAFMKRILADRSGVGEQINELELAREIGVGTSAVREFLIRFSRFGLIEKRPNSHWVLKGFTRDFALELTDVREMFELRSAAAFVALPEGHPQWGELERIERAHHDLATAMEERYFDFSELDDRFHRLINSAPHNRFIVDFHDVISMVFHYHYQWNKQRERERNTAALAEHLDYIGALKRRDAREADFYCRKHLKSARETLLASITSQ